MEYLAHIFIIIIIYAILAASLDLIAGQTGLLSLAHAAFYGVGAYSSGLLSQLGFSFLWGVALGMVVAIGISFIVSMPALRLSSNYFVIVTFGFQIIVLNIFNNWTSVTSGPLGITNVSRPRLFGWVIRSQPEFAALATVLALFTFLVVIRITGSPFGRVLRAIREDQYLAKSLGKNTLKFKVVAFATSAALAALAGSLYAHYITYIDPTSFTVMESILVISMVIIGGAGSRWGPLVGATVLVILPEMLRFVGMPSSVAANSRQIVYGSLLVVMMMFRPRGLVGKYGFGR